MNSAKHGRILSMSLLPILLLGGCIVICNSCKTPPCKANRSVTVASQMTADSTLSAQTSNGNIQVDGRDGTDCEVIADITARGNTDEEAQKIADEVVISLVPSDKGLRVDIKKPDSELSKHLAISLAVKLPRQSRLDLKTSNGNINVSDINLDATLHTSNGNITCRNVGRDIQARTSNGNVNVALNENATVNQINIGTSNGSISLTLPESFSAKVDASTSNGTVTSNRSLTGQVTISKTHMRGSLGTGQGSCNLHTSNGSIHIY